MSSIAVVHVRDEEGMRWWGWWGCWKCGQWILPGFENLVRDCCV